MIARHNPGLPSPSGPAKVICLKVQPIQVANLCFEVDGIIGASNAPSKTPNPVSYKETWLGWEVKAFDFDGFYATLRGAPTTPSDQSKLVYDSTAIQNFVNSSALFSLRAEPKKIAVDKAVNARQNAWFSKYGHIQKIANKMTDFYSPSQTGSKLKRLEKLSQLANDQVDKLTQAYTPNRLGVVKTTESTINISGSGQSNEETQEGIGLNASGNNFPSVPPPKGADFPSHTLSAGSYNQDFTESTNSDTSLQKIHNTDYAYRIPSIECQAQNERAQISLIDQQFGQIMSTLNLPNLTTALTNEGAAIDSDVNRLQIAYLNTILLSPINGIVTCVYKNVGDAVKAGEPVVRIENSDVILLVATIVYRGPVIYIGNGVQITTNLDESGTNVSISGNVIGVQGFREDDHWRVVVECSNLDTYGNPILPLGYRFDYDNVSFVFQ